MATPHDSIFCVCVATLVSCAAIECRVGGMNGSLHLLLLLLLLSIYSPNGGNGVRVSTFSIAAALVCSLTTGSGSLARFDI
jgi:hypothetical protein